MTLIQKINFIVKYCGFNKDADNVLKLCAGVLYCKKKISIEEYKRLLDIHKTIDTNQDSYILMINLMYNKIK